MRMSILLFCVLHFFPYYDSYTMHPHALSCFAWIFKQRVEPKGKETLILEPKVICFLYLTDDIPYISVLYYFKLWSWCFMFCSHLPCRRDLWEWYLHTKKLHHVSKLKLLNFQSQDKKNNMHCHSPNLAWIQLHQEGHIIMILVHLSHYWEEPAWDARKKLSSVNQRWSSFTYICFCDSKLWSWSFISCS